MGGLEQPGLGPSESTEVALGHQPWLVVLDNCEHVLAAAAAWVHRMLERCPKVTVVATSREPLEVAGELAWRVPPLELDAAVSLFESTARRARPNATLDGSEHDGVIDICRDLDGVPLAIELAAARCRSMAPSRIAAMLADRFRLLTGGPRTATARHQTLLASIDWSHRLLDEREQAALRRLAMFTAAFDLDAAEAVVAAPGDLDRFDVIDLIDRLVSKSFVTTDDGQRYRLLETIRLFALDRLDDAAETAQIRDAHCDHYAAVVAPFLGYPSDDELMRVAARYPNIVAALEWAIDRRPQRIEALLRGCSGFWMFRHRYDDVHHLGWTRAITALERHDRRAATRASADLLWSMVSADPDAVVDHVISDLGRRHGARSRQCPGQDGDDARHHRHRPRAARPSGATRRAAGRRRADRFVVDRNRRPPPTDARTHAARRGHRRGRIEARVSG